MAGELRVAVLLEVLQELREIERILRTAGTGIRLRIWIGDQVVGIVGPLHDSLPERRLRRCHRRVRAVVDRAERQRSNVRYGVADNWIAVLVENQVAVQVDRVQCVPAVGVDAWIVGQGEPVHVTEI